MTNINFQLINKSKSCFQTCFLKENKRKKKKHQVYNHFVRSLLTKTTFNHNPINHYQHGSMTHRSEMVFVAPNFPIDKKKTNSINKPQQHSITKIDNFLRIMCTSLSTKGEANIIRQISRKCN